MKPSRMLLAVVLLLATVVGHGCSKAPPPSATPPAPPVEAANPTTFSIAETNAIIAEAEIPVRPGEHAVRADFNLDKLEDIAISERDEAGHSVVSIFLRKPGDNLHPLFVNAGRIRQRGDYSVSALMSTGTTNHTDLLILFLYPDGSKELVHYRSSGNAFTEILRRPVAAAPAATTAAPPVAPP